MNSVNLDRIDTFEPVSLRRYQQRALDEVEEFLFALRDESVRQNNLLHRHAAWDAWENIRQKRLMQGVRMQKYDEMQTGDKRDLPNICLQVPTGGGKTLLATQVIASALRLLLPEREGAGLVLWLVPSQSIYEQTLAALRDPAHLYYRALKGRIGTRIKAWEKDQIGGLTPQGLRRDLNILVLMLQSVNRRPPNPDDEVIDGAKKSDFLRYFRDGRVLPTHFPPEDEQEAHRKLRDGFMSVDGAHIAGTNNLDCLGDSALVRTSLANLVRLCRPIVIVDEQQKAASETARGTLAQLNPSLLIQLSATPKQTNLLVQVSGQELLKEEMIKLPIAVHTDGIGDWQRCLSEAHRRRAELEMAADAWRANRRSDGRYIRPIAVVQAERTGQNQQDDQRYTHSEDVFRYLTMNLGVAPDQIAIKTSEKDDLKAVDLLDEACPIRWIITRDALREGWDCPFAYVLVSLLATSSLSALTQLVGRVLRQPYQKRTSDERLNQSYVFARHSETEKTVDAVKRYLGDAGLMADNFVYQERQGETTTPKQYKVARIRSEIRERYPAIRSQIGLPRFCVRQSEGGPGPTWRAFEWYTDLMPHVDDRDFNLSAVDSWGMSGYLRNARDRYTLVSLDELFSEARNEEIPREVIESDDATQAWLTINLDLPHFSCKERARIIRLGIARLLGNEPSLAGRLALVRYALRDRFSALIETETERLAHDRFQWMLKGGQLGFTRLPEECRFEVPEERRSFGGRRLLFDDKEPQQALMDFDSDDDFNGLEKGLIGTADKDPAVAWWYRNVSGEFGIQAWRRERIYPDFILQMAWDGKAAPVYLIVETKGAQLDGNVDTTYKRKVAQCFDELGKAVPWDQLEGWEHEDGRAMEYRFRFRILAEHDRLQSAWMDEWEKLKSECLHHLQQLRPITDGIALLRK